MELGQLRSGLQAEWGVANEAGAAAGLDVWRGRRRIQRRNCELLLACRAQELDEAGFGSFGTGGI